MRKPWSILILIPLLAISVYSCKPPIDKMDLASTPVLVKMDKGPAMGRYPIFNVKVYQNKVAVYEGKRYTPKLGTWVRKLDESEWKRLQDQLKTTDLWQQAPFSTSRVPDLPMVTITQYDGDAQKSVAGKENRPPEVKDLELVLENIANKEGWTLRKALDFGLPKDVVPNQLKVQLRPGVYAGNWVYKYGKQNMKILAELADKSNYWLVAYNPTITFPKEMEKLLHFDDQVQEFSFNRVSEKKK